MGIGYIIGPLIILIFYIIPIILFFIKTINRKIRIGLFIFPLLITTIFVVLAVSEETRQKELYLRFPQINKITFIDPLHQVRDSILTLKQIMGNLPKRWDHKSVSYKLEKSPLKYNNFYFNWYYINRLEILEVNSNFHNAKVHDHDSSWTYYTNSDLFPFETMSEAEAKRFLELVKYLDKNKLNAANLEHGQISLTYNDSLRISDNTGFRTITIDTNGYYGPRSFYIYDKTNGFFLLSHK